MGGEKDIFTKMAEDGIWCGFKRKTVVMTCIGRGTVVLTCAGRRNRCYDLHMKGTLVKTCIGRGLLL